MTGFDQRIGGSRRKRDVGSGPKSPALFMLNRAGTKPSWGYPPTSGCPFGLTLGPCSEWHDTISTSAGRCFSNAASSGALQEVWPPTMAPTLVAFFPRVRYTGPLQQDGSSLGSNGSKHTWPVLCHDPVDDAGLYTVKNEIANSGNEMAIREYGDPLLYTMSVWAVWPWRETYLRSELLLERFIILRSITRVYP